MNWAVVLFVRSRVSVLSDQEKCKNIILCWCRAVCSLGEWREVRWSRWRAGINLALLFLWCCRPPLLGCVAFSDAMLLCILSASIHVPFVSFDSSLRCADIFCPWIFFFISSLHHIFPLALPSLCDSSALWDCYCRSVSIHNVWPRPREL